MPALVKVIISVPTPKISLKEETPSTIIRLNDICKAPTLRLKARSKHNITHTHKNIEMENVMLSITKANT